MTDPKPALLPVEQVAPCKARSLFWRPVTDHPQDHDEADWVAFGFGGRYAIQKPKPVRESLRDGVKPGTTVIIKGKPHWKALLWWPEDEFTFATFDSVANAKIAANEHYQAEFAKRVDDMPHGMPRDMYERGFVPPYITDRLATPAPTCEEPGEVEEIWSIGGANSHVFERQIIVDGTCVAFSDERWTPIIIAALSHPKQQDRPRTAAVPISAGNSELEPDDRQDQRNRSPDRQSCEFGEIRGRAPFFAGGLQRSERDVRSEVRDDHELSDPGRVMASRPAASAENGLREALNRIADLGGCSDGKVSNSALFQQAINIAIEAITSTATPSQTAENANGHERCPECLGLTFTFIDERQADGKFRPGKDRRCINCKLVIPAENANCSDQPQAGALDREAECPSCHGLNTSCPQGCGRDPMTGELNGQDLQQMGTATIEDDEFGSVDISIGGNAYLMQANDTGAQLGIVLTRKGARDLADAILNLIARRA